MAQPHEPQPIVTALRTILERLGQGHEGLQEALEEIDQAAVNLREMLDRLTRLHVEMEGVDTLYEVVEAAGQLCAEAAHLVQLLADAEEAVERLEAELEG